MGLVIASPFSAPASPAVSKKGGSFAASAPTTHMLYVVVGILLYNWLL